MFGKLELFLEVGLGGGEWADLIFVCYRAGCLNLF